MLSYAAWQTRYGKRADVIGQTVTLDGNPNTIVGVLPRDFHFAPAEPAEFWTAEHDESDCRGRHWLFGLARLKDGVTLDLPRHRSCNGGFRKQKTLAVVTTAANLRRRLCQPVRSGM